MPVNLNWIRAWWAAKTNGKAEPSESKALAGYKAHDPSQTLTSDDMNYFFNAFSSSLALLQSKACTKVFSNDANDLIRELAHFATPDDLTDVNFADQDCIGFLPGNHTASINLALGRHDLEFVMPPTASLDLTGGRTLTLSGDRASGTLRIKNADADSVVISGADVNLQLWIDASLAVKFTGTGTLIVNGVLYLSGTSGSSAIPFNRLSDDFSHVLGTATQVTNDQATIKQAAGVFKNKADEVVTLVAGDSIRVKAMDPLTADLTFAVRVRLEGDPGVALNTAGFKVVFAGDKSTAKGLYFTNVAIAGLEVTGNDIVDFSIFADATGRLVDSVLGYTARLKNLGVRNRLGLNGQMAYDYSRTSSIIWCAGDYLPAYSLPSGGSYDPALFKDLAHVNTEAEPWGLGPIHGLDVGNYKLPPYPGRFLRVHDNSHGVDPDRTLRGDRGDGTTGDAIGTPKADALQGFKVDVSGAYVLDNVGVSTYNGVAAKTADQLNAFVSNTVQGTLLPITDGINGTPRTSSTTYPTNIYVGVCLPV